MKTKRICKNQWQKKRKKALYKQAALVKAAKTALSKQALYAALYTIALK